MNKSKMKTRNVLKSFGTHYEKLKNVSVMLKKYFYVLRLLILMALEELGLARKIEFSLTKTKEAI